MEWNNGKLQQKMKAVICILGLDIHTSSTIFIEKEVLLNEFNGI